MGGGAVVRRRGVVGVCRGRGVRIFFVVEFRVPRQKYMHREEYEMKKRELV
jgi:hypothetical protein